MAMPAIVLMSRHSLKSIRRPTVERQAASLRGVFFMGVLLMLADFQTVTDPFIRLTLEPPNFSQLKPQKH